MSRGSTQLPLLILLIAGGLLMVWMQHRTPGSVDSGMISSSGSGEPCPEAMSEVCSEGVRLPPTVDVVVLNSASVCVNVGYLCADLETTDSLRIQRWPEDTGRLRIRVPTPAGVSASRARDLQSAAVRGIQYWQHRPFELVIDTNPTATSEADIEVEWGEGLSGVQLGLTRTGWSPQTGQFEVLRFTLAMYSPANSTNPIGPEHVMLTAAHEMGHALGLQHSDSERDVMYPMNTAPSLSTRDFRTVQALYRLPNGAVIRSDL